MKQVRKLSALLLAGLMLAALCACGGSGNKAASGGSVTTVEKGKLHMATNAAFPPYEMMKDGGGFEGIDVEIATKIAERLGLELVVDDMDFDAALLAAQNGKSDMVMAGVTVTEARKEVMTFSDSYATGTQVVIVKSGSDVTMDNLGDHMIGCQKATTGYLYASDTPENGGYGEDHVVAFDNGSLAVEALKSGKVDCVIIDNEPAKAFVAENSGLELLDGDWVVEDYAIGFQKGNTQLVDAVNNVLKELIADGTVKSIIDSYISAY